MKINTITCHDVYNPGASLQAYALQRYLETLGHDVKIIDYKPDYLSNHYNLLAITNPKYDKFIIRWLYLLAKLPSRIISLKRKRIFDCFKKKYLKITSKRYHSNKELSDNLPDADIYIAGSDQIWNTLFPNGKDPAFYLDFVPNSKIKASYAASFSTPTIDRKYIRFIIEKLKNFNYISVRESSGIQVLHEMGYTNALHVCDPVFLLSNSDWDSLVKRLPIKSKYLLVYDFDNSSQIQQIAKEIAKRKNWIIVSIFPTKYANKSFPNAGPIEFISLIKNADFVISNSFHALAFSIIFQKLFCIINRRDNINERMHSLLKEIQLTNRIVNCFREELLLPIDYDKVLSILSKRIIDSKHYLHNISLYNK